MRRSTWFRWLVCAGIGAWLLGAVPAGADECEEKWLQCLERCYQDINRDLPMPGDQP